ncbi:MAG: response regulator [Opitutales bacterium]|nr:response regulator [Opitutales bacterium]
MKSVLDEDDLYRLHVEFMDSKRIDYENDWSYFVTYLASKYSKKKIDAVYVTDDNALDAMLLFRDRMGLEVPIFFSGVNRPPSEVLQNPWVKGAFERISVQKTVDFALAQHPKTRRIWILKEDSNTGDLLYSAIMSSTVFPKGVEVQLLENMSAERQLDKAALLPEDSVVLVVNYQRDVYLNNVDQRDFVNRYAMRTEAPVYICYTFQFGENAVGGMLIDGETIGRKAGRKLQKFLEGTPIEEIECEHETEFKWVFSAKALKRAGILKRNLPDGHELVFEEEQISLRALAVVFVVAVFIALQAFLILILIRGRRKLQALTRKLKISRSELESWIAHAPLPIAVFASDGERVSMNHQFVVLFNYGEKDFRNPSEMWKVMVQDDSKRTLFFDRWDSALKNAEVAKQVIEDVHIWTKSGKAMVLEVHVSVINNSLICFFIDMTWRFQIERELEGALDQAFEANQAKTQFLTNMSHEIRTPLNGVLGMTQLLGETELSAEQSEYANVILKSGERLLTTINDILDLSKIESGQLAMESIPFDLKKCLQDSVEVCLPKLRKEDVEFRLVYPKKGPQTIIGDPFRVSQIMVNLLNNAFKYTESGNVELRVEFGAVVNSSLEVKIEVQDTGMGISEDKQKGIFEPFSQADSSITRQYGGTGLGLTICKKLAELIGGEISLESQLNKGSTFTIVWKADLDEASINERQQVPHSDVAGEDFGWINVLVVEDNAVNIKVVDLALKKLGVEAEKVTNGREALDLLEERVFDLIFMDIQMPVMDGLTATTEIRRRSYEKYPYVVALTAHALEEHRQQCRSAGMDGFVAKPFTANDLKEVIQTFCDWKRLQ